MGNFRHSVIDLRKTAINDWEFPKEEFWEFKYVLLIASISNRLIFIFQGDCPGCAAWQAGVLGEGRLLPRVQVEVVRGEGAAAAVGIYRVPVKIFKIEKIAYFPL